MSLKDCVKLVKLLDPDDREAFQHEFDSLTKGGVPAEEAYVEAAEIVMDWILDNRNKLAEQIEEKGGFLGKLTLENLVNPASYKPGTGTAADIATMSANEFESMLEEVSPAPKDTNPVPAEPAKPKAKTAEEEVVRFINERKLTTKRPKRVTSKELKEQLKKLGMSGYSSMTKDEAQRELMKWYEARRLAELPDPFGKVQGHQLRAAIYNRADSSMGVVVNWAGEQDSVAQINLEAWVEYYGGTRNKTKRPTYEGNKTDKGHHFIGLQQFEQFYKGYTGETVDIDRMIGRSMGELGHIRTIEEIKPGEEFIEGQAVMPIAEHYHGLEGEVIIIGRDPYDNRPLYTVRFEDPESGDEFTEVFDGAELREPPPPKPPSKNARAALENAAKHGVKGADEALTGLTELFGGKGKFTSGFTFDEETYAKAKPHFKKALEEFVAAGKSLKEFLQFIVENFGEGIKPYLRQFHQDIADDKITIRGVNDVQPTTPDAAETGRARQEQADQGDTADAGTEPAAVPGAPDQRPAEERGVPVSSIGLPVDSTVDVGEQADTGILGDTGEFRPATGVTGHQDGRRGTVVGAEGVPADSPGYQKAQADARSTRDRLKRPPTSNTWVQSDPQNVAETVPALFPEQADDVVFAENRLFDNGHRGVMFTNGTGTGKTLTGLGVAKRFVLQGRDNILIVVPGEKVARDWIKTGNAPSFDLGITKLKNIKDAGQGVVVTTYANFADNNAILHREWDLVIHDEAHKLSENMAGNATNALIKSRAITGHPDGEHAYAAGMEADLLDEIKGINSQMKDLQKRLGNNEFMTPDQVKKHNDRYNELSEKQDELQAIWRERLAEHRQNRQGLWNAKTTKRLDLTATPFAYEKSVDHAEGFLFEYDREAAEQRSGYNAPDARQAFMMEHFGYHMRTGKLNEPPAEVDRGLMQRQFNQWLKEQGALRGRVLTVDHDYSREFVAIDDLIGKKIDDGYDWITKRAMDKENPKARGYDMMLNHLRKTFNYHARVRMLEAIKAKWAVERARKHMELGRKVVLFHSRIQGGTINPFHLFAGAASLADSDIAATDEDQALYQAAAAEFVAERHDLMTLDINTKRPLDLFAEEFGDQLTVYNGTITNKQKTDNPDKFNSDAGEIQVIAVQDEGGKEGISLHDATGANQRVLINLGLPVRPTQAIQIEGRIYRVGQMSNAIFEYFNTGTNFERMTFAEKISERASTAENLAMGEQARTLKDSFIDAYEDPTFEDPSEGQGLGGKEKDRALWESTSEFERAKSHYFGTMKTKGRRDQRAGLDYFATPEPLGVKMVEWAGIKPGDTVLEPSAGHGAIGRYFPELASATFIEPSAELLSRLALRAPGNHRQMRFEDLDVGGNKFNAIVMNPPFGAGGKTAIDHLHKAMHHLKNGGRIVALIPEGPAADKKFEAMFYGKEGELEQLRENIKQKRREGGSISYETRRIDDLTNYHLRASISLPAVTFSRAGTGVSSRIVVIDKVANTKASLVNQSPRDVFADTIKDFFDKIEDMTVPERTQLQDSAEEYLAKEGLIVSHDEANGVWRLLGRTYDHRQMIKRALGDDVTYSGAGWVSQVDPTDLLYQEMTAPRAAQEASPAKPTQADINAAAAALMGKPPFADRAVPGTGERMAQQLERFETAETTHAKKGIDLFVASFKERVGKDEYTRVLKIAKKHGGYYSAYKAKGAVPGFQFESAEARAAFMEEALQEPLAMRQALPKEWEPAVATARSKYRGVPAISLQLMAADAARAGRTPAEWLSELESSPPDASIYRVGYERKALRDRRSGGSTKAQVEQWLAKPLKRISSRVPIEIVTSVKQLLTTMPLATDAKGFYFNGKVVLVAENIRDARDAEIAFTHEVVGHLGVIGVLGRKKTNELIGDITNMKVEEMLTPGTHPDLARILDQLRRSYVDKNGKYNLDPKDEALEVIAHIAQEKPRVGPLVEIYNKVMLWIKQFLARLGLADPDMLKIEEALVRATDFVKDPPAHYTGEGSDGVAAMRVYHVSDQEFESFDTEKATKSKGVGMMNYGFGHYFSGMEQAADHFRQLFESEGRPEVHTYEAWIAPTSEELLQWQESYWMQPERVRGALTMLLEMQPERFEALDMTGGAAYRKAEREIKAGTELGARIKDIARTRGMDIDSWPADRIVSMALHQLGVRGTRYVEKFGRGQQGLNYVIFSDEDVSVLSRATQQRVDIDVQKPLASRAPQRKEPQGDMTREEFERYKKLGLVGKQGLWDRINDFRKRGVVQAMDEAFARGYEGLFDGLLELKRKEVEAGVGLGAGDYAGSAYIAARLATGVADMMSHIMHYGPLRWFQGVGYHAGKWQDSQGADHKFRGLLEVLSELGPEQLNDWLMWMGANRAKQLMAEGRERNLSEDDIKFGLSKAEGREELFTRIKEEYAAMNKAMLNFAEEAGLIDPVKRAEWESEWYVPFYRLAEDEIEAPRLKRGLSHQEAGIRRLFGSEIPTADLLENIITNWLKLTDASVKNHALRLMIDNFDGKQDLEGMDYITHETMRFTKVLVPRSEIRKRIVQDRAFAKQVAEFLGMEETANNLEIIHEVNKIPAEGFEQLWAVTAPKEDDIVRLKRNGKNEYWRVNVPGLLRAVGHMSPRGFESHGGMRAARWFKRLLTTGVTLSPDFMLRNFIRDMVHSWAINPDNMFFAKDSIVGLARALEEGHPLYTAAMGAGASFQGGYVHATDPEASAQIIRRELEKRGLTDAAIHAHMGSIVNTPAKLKSTALRLWQKYRETGDRIENANRLAVIQKALDAGKPLIQALYESKDLMDYSRRGNYAMLIAFTDMMPFLNARLQGVDKLRRATMEHPKIVAKKLAYLMTFSVILAAMNDDDDRYKELPDWEKDAYWHLFPGGEHIRIPKPFEIGIIGGTIPERMYRAWVTKSQPSDKLKWSIWHNLMDTMNINYGLPQFMLPAIEVLANRSIYFDQPIESLSDEQVTPRERANAFTSPVAMELADTALAEWLRMSPKQIQHLWNGYTGTMGAYALKAADMLVRGVSDKHPSREAIQPHDLPILRAVYQGQRVKGTQYATDFYDRMKEVSELHGDIQRYMQRGERQRALEYREKHKAKLQQRRRMERVRDMFSQLRKRRDQILRDPSLSPNEKYEKQQAIQVRINTLAKKIEAETRAAFAD